MRTFTGIVIFVLVAGILYFLWPREGILNQDARLDTQETDSRAEQPPYWTYEEAAKTGEANRWCRANPGQCKG